MSQENIEDVDDVEGKVFIGGLSWQTTEGTLRSHFEKFGELTDVALMVDKRTGQPRGFGFIRLKYPQSADIVVSQEHVIDGRKVDVKKAVPRDRAPAPTRTESKKIFVGGLSADVTDKIFHEYFSKFGVVKDAVVMVDRSTNRSRGFGFVTFESEEAVDNVIKTENTILGKWVEVKRAEPRDMTRFDGPSGRGGFRGRGPGDSRGGRYGLGGRGLMDEYPNAYGAMGPYGRGYGAAFPQGYGPAHGPYGMQSPYGGGAFAGYPAAGYPGYGPTGPTAYSTPQGYGARAHGHDGESPSSNPSSGQSAGYGGASPSPSGAPPQAVGSGYDGYGRGQQFPYPTTAMGGGYGGAYGVYGASTGTARNMTAQDGYEGAYGAYRNGAAQNRLDRSFKPY